MKQTFNSIAMPNQKITIDQKITELKRELALRQKVYPKWAKSAADKKRMDKQIAILQSIITDYETVLADILKIKELVGEPTFTNISQAVDLYETALKINLQPEVYGDQQELFP